MTNKYIKTCYKKLYILNSENVAKNFLRLVRHFLPEMSTFHNHEEYIPLLPKKETNDLAVICAFPIDF